MPPSPVRLDFVLAIMPILRARLFLEERNMVREPMLTTVPIADLRPTQLTVGMREVKAKHKRWREIAADFERAVEKAIRLAKSEDAAYLPGWCGPLEEA
jgi:hypothetical protein